ncbi:MAG: phytoene desaturase family protein [Actinomycetota bacterium]|nr:phytoene desaturase family protein [Actinomycetota bacterium]
MRTVPGPTTRVVVVGAGLGGLSAALHLVAAGREVTVLERGPLPGGRAGLLDDAGYAFDTGPTVLTMPDLLADALGAVGEELSDWLDLRPLDPVYRAFFPDGSTLDVRSDPAAMAEEVRRVCGPEEAGGYERFVQFASRLYRYERDDFIDRNTDSPLGVLTPNLARLAAVGGFRRLAPKVSSYLKDPRTQRVFSFQSLYAGVSPYEALAIYAVIAYMDAVSGVVAPVGGMHAVPRALAGAAEKHGATIRYGECVARVVVERGRAVGVETTAGELVPADVVVLNPDLPAALDLLPPTRRRRLRASPSCFLLLAGSTQDYTKAAHHNLHFGREWRPVFADLTRRGRLMADPSLLVTSATKTDPSLAPANRHSYSVLAPTPNQTAGIDWQIVGPRYREELMHRLEGLGYKGFGDAIEVEHVTTPLDWERQGLVDGTPFSYAHTLTQTGPFRPGNLVPHAEGVVLTGSGTRPGVGVPMVLLSGRLAAERITG